jgi:DNA-binding IclR family transcriptional regulator
MEHSQSTNSAPGADEKASKGQGGSQTLLRGLDVLEVVSEGSVTLAQLAARLELTRSTTYRLASALVDRRLLNFTPREGYSLGPKLIELGFRAQSQVDLARLARPYLERLAAMTEDTVHLGIMDRGRALYLDKIPGRRRIDISSRVGERQPLRSTGLGKALLLDEDEERWRELFDQEATPGAAPLDYGPWLERMRGYANGGYAFDLEENEDRIRCVAAPLRDAGDRIIGAISVSSAAQYMDDQRMADLVREVKGAAADISHEFGWTPEADARRARKPG